MSSFTIQLSGGLGRFFLKERWTDGGSEQTARIMTSESDFLLNFSRVLGGLGGVLVSDDRYANDSVSLSEEWASC